MSGGIKQYFIAFAVFAVLDFLMVGAQTAGWSDFWFGEFARGQMGGFVMGAVYWSRNPFPVRR
jgi:hypothetical protein